MRDPFTLVDPTLNLGFFAAVILGNDEIDQLAQGFACGVPEHLFGCVIPGRQDAVEIFAVDRNVRRVDDRRQVRRLVKAFPGH